LGDPELQGHGLFGSNPPSPASGHEYENAMPWPHDERQLPARAAVISLRLRRRS
jgi:hypothetical protein